MNVMRTFHCPLFAAFMVLLAACGGDQGPKDGLNVDADTGQSERLDKTRKIFYSIPSPMETAALLKKAGADYNGKLLNDVKNVDKYTSASKQALNLGIYGADLSYTSVFNNAQESMFYTSVAKKLADQLGVSNAFNDSTLEAMERSLNDRDALLDIISETYWNVDAYLKENERDNISALMIAGGWVEGLYIATQVSKTNDAQELRQRIAEQKFVLDDLADLVDSYGTDEPALLGVRKDLGELQALFADVDLGGGSTNVTEANGVAQIGNDAQAAGLSDAQLAAIREKVAAIRNNYIN